MSNKVLALVVFAAIVIVGGVVFYLSRPQKAAAPNPADQSAQQTAIPTSSLVSSQSQQCQKDFDANKLKTAKVDIKNKFVEIEVANFGNIKLQLYDQDTPNTVENFLRLVNAGFYDCLTFHRIAQGFVIQGGDPNGDGSGGITASGQTLADELNPNTASYKAGYLKGVLAMAETSAPNTATSQFFIMLADNQLAHNYPIFGKVVEGQDIVDKIGQVPITPQMGSTDGTPKTPIIMQKVYIVNP